MTVVVVLTGFEGRSAAGAEERMPHTHPGGGVRDSGLRQARRASRWRGQRAEVGGDGADPQQPAWLPGSRQASGPGADRTRAEHGLGSDSKYRALLQTKCHGGPVTPKSLVYLINSVKLLVSSVGKKPRRASSLADAGVCSA